MRAVGLMVATAAAADDDADAEMKQVAPIDGREN